MNYFRKIERLELDWNMGIPLKVCGATIIAQFVHQFTQKPNVLSLR